jgi:hypothetical protein
MFKIAIPSYVEILGARSPAVVVTTIGDGTDYDTLVWQAGPPIPPKAELDVAILAEAKQRQWKAVQGRRDFLKANGVKVGNYWFHGDDSSRIQQLGLVLFGANMPQGIMWKAMDNSFVLMTPTLAMQIFTGHAQHDTIVFSIAEQKRSAVNALTTLEEVAAFDHDTGWPATFTA